MQSFKGTEYQLQANSKQYEREASLPEYLSTAGTEPKRGTSVVIFSSTRLVGGEGGNCATLTMHDYLHANIKKVKG